jgi:hypothetical protein
VKLGRFSGCRLALLSVLCMFHSGRPSEARDLYSTTVRAHTSARRGSRVFNVHRRPISSGYNPSENLLVIRNLRKNSELFEVCRRLGGRGAVPPSLSSGFASSAVTSVPDAKGPNPMQWPTLGLSGHRAPNSDDYDHGVGYNGCDPHNRSKLHGVRHRSATHSRRSGRCRMWREQDASGYVTTVNIPSTAFLLVEELSMIDTPSHRDQDPMPPGEVARRLPSEKNPTRMEARPKHIGQEPRY